MEPGDTSVGPQQKGAVARWASRGMVVLGGLLVVALASYWVWGVRVERRLEARMRALSEAGEPIYPKDFVTTAPPAGQNAADDLVAAGKIAARQDGVSAAVAKLEHLAPPLTSEEADLLAKFVDGRRGAFDLVESASRKPAVWWDLDPTQPVAVQNLPGLTGLREVANLLKYEALLAHRRGAHADAVARVAQLEPIARAVGHQPVFVSHLVAVGIAALQADTAEQLAPDLQIGGERRAAPADVRALIAALLDDTWLRGGMAHALRGERKEQWLLATALLTGAPTPGAQGAPAAPAAPAAPNPGVTAGVRRFGLKPFVLGNADASLQFTTGMIRQFERTSDLPAFNAGGEHHAIRAQINASPRRYLLAQMLIPSMERVVETHYRAIMERRLAAVALAVRWYAADHGGRLPASLGELAPAYLPAVPADPFAAGGAPLRYRANGADPVVYSVGVDGKDDGGDATLRPGARAFGGVVDRWSGKDAVLHLNRQPRPKPESDDAK